jgi:hypothetical protein
MEEDLTNNYELVELLQDLHQFADPMSLFSDGAELRYPNAKEKVMRMVENINFLPSAQIVGSDSIAYLHYSLGDVHFYISGRDKEEVQRMAFGCICLPGRVPQLDYISIVDIVRCGAHLDFDWKPVPMDQVNMVTID